MSINKSPVLYKGDCLKIFPEIETSSVDAVLTDPPYMIGASSVGKKRLKAGGMIDMENASYWFAEWFRESKRVLKDSGYLVAFGNWRSLPTLISGLSKAGMESTSCLIWDKLWIGPAGKSQLRGRYELAIFSAMPDAVIKDRSVPDIFSCKWQAGNMKTTPHPAEKPLQLMEFLIRHTVPEHGVVLDPFMGSGTTGVAAANLERAFIGIESEDQWFEVAQQRLIDETAA